MLLKELTQAPNLRLANETRDKWPDLISYLSFLRQSFGPRLDKLDLSKVAGLKVQDGKLIIESINKAEINKAAQETEQAEEVKLPAGLLEGLKNLQIGNVQRRIQNIEAEIAREIANIRERNRQTAGLFSRVMNSRQELANLTANGSIGLEDKVLQIVKDGFWLDPQFNSVDKSLRFHTQDVWLGFNESVSGINKTINMGSFALRFVLREGAMDVQVIQNGNNMNVMGFPHPHVSDQYLCLGNASNSWAEASDKLDLPRMASIARIILTTYNPDNPYRPFHEFEAEHNRRQRHILRPINEQQLREQYQSSSTDELDWFDDELSAL